MKYWFLVCKILKIDTTWQLKSWIVTVYQGAPPVKSSSSSLLEKCPYLEFFCVSTCTCLHTEIYRAKVHIQSKCRKIWTRKIPNASTFYIVLRICRQWELHNSFSTLMIQSWGVDFSIYLEQFFNFINVKYFINVSETEFSNIVVIHLNIALLISFGIFI